MFTESKKEEKLEFRGGMFGLILPFIVLFVGIIMLSVAGKAMSMAFWAPALAAVLVALIMAKRPTQCADMLIIMMYKGVHLIVALMIAGSFGILLGLVTGLLPLGRLLVVDMDAFAVSGVLVEGIMSLIDIAIFAMLLMGLINLLDKGGFFGAMMVKLANYTKTPVASELVIALINIVLCCLTVANSVVIVMEGPIAKKVLVEKHNISPDRSANILDAVSCCAMCLIPYSLAPLLAYMFAGGSGAPPAST